MHVHADVDTAQLISHGTLLSLVLALGGDIEDKKTLD